MGCKRYGKPWKQEHRRASVSASPGSRAERPWVVAYEERTRFAQAWPTSYVFALESDARAFAARLSERGIAALVYTR